MGQARYVGCPLENVEQKENGLKEKSKFKEVTLYLKINFVAHTDRGRYFRNSN